MARRLLDAAAASRHLAAWSDEEEVYEDTVESEDSEDDEPPSEDDATNCSVDNASSTVGSQSETEDEESGNDNSESDSDDLTARSSFTGRNGRVWVTTCPPPSRTRACNLRHTSEGPLGASKDIENEVDAFACFIDENMLKHIVKHTNERARRDLRTNAS